MSEKFYIVQYHVKILDSKTYHTVTCQHSAAKVDIVLYKIFKGQNFCDCIASMAFVEKVSTKVLSLEYFIL